MGINVRFVLLNIILVSVSSCSSAPRCTHALPEHLRMASHETIANSGTGPQQLFGFYKCRASLGEEESQYRLGLLYELGRGTDQDFERAARRYEEAAKTKSGLEWASWDSVVATRTGNSSMGHPIAQYSLGLMYLNGRGVDQSTNLALLWLRRSARQGYELAEIAILEIEE